MATARQRGGEVSRCRRAPASVQRWTGVRLTGAATRPWDDSSPSPER